MEPTTGRILHYRLSSGDVEQITRRRYGNARAIYCEPGGKSSASGAFVGPCVETNGGQVSGQVVSIVSIIAGAAITILAGLATAGAL